MSKLHFGIATLALFAGSMAGADVLIGNYPPTNDSTQSADVDNLRQKAIMFTMPAGSSYDITSITLRLGNYITPGDGAILELRDHTGVNTAPGATVLGMFTAPLSNSSAIGDFVFSPVGTITVLPGTAYWIVARGVDAATSYDWKGSSPGKTPTGIATYGSNLFTSNGGTSWSNSSIINTFQIDGVIPAPGTAALLGLGGLIALRRRR